MPEYTYNKKFKIWYCIEDSPFERGFWNMNNKATIDSTKLLSKEKIDELKNARKNKKYLIYDNRLTKRPDGSFTRLRYPGIDSDYIYQDISDLKLIICNGTRYLLMYSLPNCSSLGRIPTSYIMNNEIVDPNKQDFSIVVDYVERNAHADMHDSEYLKLSDEEKEKKFKERLRLYYDDLDDDAKLVYNVLGTYDLSE